MANACTRGSNANEESKPRAAKASSKGVEKESIPSSSASASGSVEAQPPTESGGEGAMSGLIDEAQKMLKSLQQNEPREKAVSAKLTEGKVEQLQRQLDELKKASLRPFRISKINSAVHNGLLDSGATHPLRARVKGEDLQHLRKLNLTLAGDR